MTVKNFRTLVFWAVAVLMQACMSDDLDYTAVIVDTEVNYLAVGMNRDALPNNSYRLIGVQPTAAGWNVVVEYSGGCNSHLFYTWWDGSWSEGEPADGQFYLRHDARGDACEANVRDTLFIELPKVFPGKANPHESFVSVVNDSDQRTITVDPFLAQISQQLQCDLEAELVSFTCGEGIWSNHWLKLRTPMEPYQTVYLQPVRRGGDVPQVSPGVGAYRVGVGLLFGFQYGGTDPQYCMTKDGERVLPVSIRCINPL